MTLRSVVALGLAVALSVVTGCAGPSATLGWPRARTLRLSDVNDGGDPVRRASLRLVDQGLDYDEAGDYSAARARYQRAIQVDPHNPYAYLAISRHYVETDDPARGLQSLEQAEVLLETQGLLSPRVAPHIVGLRGSALALSGRRREAAPLLSQAGDFDPNVWADGVLSADELR